MRATMIAAALLCQACVSTVSGTDRGGHGKTNTYVGFVRVRVAEVTDGLGYADVRALGLGWDGAAFVGWRSGQWVTADPARCQLLVVIRSGVEARAAADVFEKLGEQQPCIADFRSDAERARSPVSPPPR